MKFLHLKPLSALLALAPLLFAGCSRGLEYDGGYPSDSAIATEPSGNGGQGSGGIVTAGEWNDLANWGFWANLLNGNEWQEYGKYWQFYPQNFVCVETVDASGVPVPGVKVTLSQNGQDVWQAVSDNSGRATLWAEFYTGSAIADDGWTLDAGGTQAESFEFTTLSLAETAVNSFTVESSDADDSIDVAFIVDATGSMLDEIDFLKEDLDDIIAIVQEQVSTPVRTGTVFYRDIGDEYLTRHSQLTDDLASTRKFISEQQANGGGDYPEAVHSALETGLQNLSWNSGARSRVAFLVLDAPPHSESEVIAACQKIVREYAAAGIKIVPVAASGIDKSCEYLLRSFGLATGGTYVFLTNDSGVGADHIAASVGDHQVEKLRDLIARLIIAYAK